MAGDRFHTFVLTEVDEGGDWSFIRLCLPGLIKVVYGWRLDGSWFGSSSLLIRHTTKCIAMLNSSRFKAPSLLISASCLWIQWQDTSTNTVCKWFMWGDFLLPVHVKQLRAHQTCGNDKQNVTVICHSKNRLACHVAKRLNAIYIFNQNSKKQLLSLNIAVRQSVY